MSSPKFSKKSASEGGTANLTSYPGPSTSMPGGRRCYEENQGSELFCTHKQECNSKVETITQLGRTDEKEACLFPTSCSDSDLKTKLSSTPLLPLPVPGYGVGRNSNNNMSNSVNISCSTTSTSDSASHCSKTFPREATAVSPGQCSSNSKFPQSLCDPQKVQLPPSSCDPKSDLDETNIEAVPAKALNVPTRTRLSLMLNPPKVRRNDWTGLASEMGFEYEMIENISLERDPMKIVLAQWTCQQGSTIGALLEMLKDLQRDDVLLDITKLVERDARRWLNKRDADGRPIQDPEVSGSYPHVPKTKELRGITLEDHPSGPPEIFDAYVCFTDVDSDFVKEMISVLENEPYNLKLCVDFRDLVPGGSYSTVTAELIENRCKRMIIVLSPDFLASEQCDFQTKFAHSIAPSARNKRLIPVMVEPCVLPTILRHITICDYTKKDLRRWFWKRLNSSLSHS